MYIEVPSEPILVTLLYSPVVLVSLVVSCIIKLCGLLFGDQTLECGTVVGNENKFKNLGMEVNMF